MSRIAEQIRREVCRSQAHADFQELALWHIFKSLKKHRKFKKAEELENILQASRKSPEKSNSPKGQ